MVEKSTLTKETQKMLLNMIEPEEDTSFIETGNIGFDMAISNGLGMPVGNSILLWAAPGCGKTTLFADVSRRLIKIHKSKGEDFKVLYIAVEGSRELMKKLGLKEYMQSRDFIYIERQFTWRQIEQLYDAVLMEAEGFKGVKLIIVDSTNNVLSDQNTKNSVADGDFGTRSRERSNFYSKYLPKCKEKGITSFFVSQVRQNQNAGNSPYAEKKRAAVGDPDKHNVDIIIKCSSKSDSKDASKVEIKTAFGTSKEVRKYIMILDPTKTDCKNRIASTHVTEILIEKGVGAHNYYVVRKILEFHGLVKVSGAWYSFDKSLCDAFDLPTTKLSRANMNEKIAENIAGLVAFMKESGYYTIESSSEVVREIEGDSEEAAEVEEE